jgi:uncharacterized protein (DUF2062 family)
MSKKTPPSTDMIHRMKTTAHPFCKRLSSSNRTPRDVALGFALGLMVGMTPFLGIHIVSCIVLAARFGGNKFAAILGVNITNIVTAPLIYPINYWVGQKLVGISDTIPWSINGNYTDILTFVKESPLILADLFIGGMVLGIPLAVIGYFSVLTIMHIYQKRRNSQQNASLPLI